MPDYGDFIQGTVKDVLENAIVLHDQLDATLRVLLARGDLRPDQMISLGWKLKEL